MKASQSLTLTSSLDFSWQRFIEGLDEETKMLFLKLDHIKQLHILNQIPFSEKMAQSLVDELKEIDAFFAPCGGIIGYQKALREISNPIQFSKKILQAPYIAISDGIASHRHAIKACIDHVPQLAEVYAIGGAADRLNLKSGQQMLPAACLKIAQKTLLEYLIHDIEAKEWLYYKLHHKTALVPLVMMTSFEKNNQTHIFQILNEHQFFNRPQESFLIFHQPLVPMVDETLEWQTNQTDGLFLKPGGHGAIWGLCLKEKVFEKLKNFHVSKLSIRQINNPIACIDYGHFAFLGYGFLKDAEFGFYACERFAGSQEGINVLLKDEDGKLCLTNIEYCQLESVGIDDVADAKGLSQFPANTNVLFVDLDTLKSLTQKEPLPGKILNYKTFAWDGKIKPCARLETMMQNMADYIHEDALPLSKTYMTLSSRVKTISPVKRQKQVEGSYQETPQACFYDFMKNACELFDRAGISYPKLDVIEKYFQFPTFMFHYLPALGPFFEIIAQKLKGGIIERGSYLNLDLAELDLENLYLKGSLTIQAKNPYGLEKGPRCFSERAGRALIKNCKFINKGIDYENLGAFYQDGPKFLESCQIILEGFSEFHAENISFDGPFLFKVPDGYRLDVFYDEDKKLKTSLSKITKPSWTYHYAWSEDCLLVTKGNQ